MSTVYYIGENGWRRGNRTNRGQDGIDRSVWIENERKLHKVSDYNVYLYLLEDTRQANVFKFGIACDHFYRCKQVNIDCQHSPCDHKFKVLDSVFIGERSNALLIEEMVLNSLKDYRLYKRAIFSGATEVFKFDKKLALDMINTIRNLKNNKKLLNIK